MKSEGDEFHDNSRIRGFISSHFSLFLVIIHTMTSSKLVYKNNFEKNAYALVELNTPELVEAFESGIE